MKRFAFLSACLVIGSVLAARGPALANDPKSPPRPTVQIAILLDTSNSMDGLIGQAKAQLWNVVNEFVRRKKDGRPPAIQVALFEYGKQTLSSGEGFVRLILPLTDDLDRVSEELFALKTNGGEEYCGWVIRDAVNRLEWSRSRDVYKAIFIAGNEPFTQGTVDFHASCRAAIERGIMVNTIFCGPNQGGLQTGWKDGAVLADGRYMSIDQNQKVVEIPAPQDARIAQLGAELNKTYLPYGRMGQVGQTRQMVQDANASAVSPSALASRSFSKANSVYCNDAWDLVDAIKNGKCKLEELKAEDLPEGLRKLDTAGRKAKVEEAGRQRGEIQAKINELSKEREAFLAAERKKRSEPKDKNTLDRAITGAVRDQAARHNFTLRVVSWMASESWSSRTTRQSGGAWSTPWASPDMPPWKPAREPRRAWPRRSSRTATSCCWTWSCRAAMDWRSSREIRAMRSPLPVIVLTARGSEDDRVRGLALGADDYVVKPFCDQGAAGADRGRAEADAGAAAGRPRAWPSTGVRPISSGTRSRSTTASGASCRIASGSSCIISPATPAGRSRATSCWRGCGA